MSCSSRLMRCDRAMGFTCAGVARQGAAGSGGGGGGPPWGPRCDALRRRCGSTHLAAAKPLRKLLLQPGRHLGQGALAAV